MSHPPSSLSQRDFLKVAAMGTVGLLAECRSANPPTNTPIPLPPTLTIRRPDIIQFYPDVKSKVVHTHHAGAWAGDKLIPGALRQMLDASITQLTGLDNARDAWAALFHTDERIAIKVNAIGGGVLENIYTHPPLALAVAECLHAINIPAEQIVLYDRYTSELENAGYPINRDGPGVHCYGTNDSGPFLRSSHNSAEHYTFGWKIMDVDFGLSDILLTCHALINMPVLTAAPQLGEGPAGISFAMKNHYGTINCPTNFHSQRFVRGLTELNTLPPIKDRTRLVIGDILTANSYDAYGRYVIGGGAILTSFDTVALDAIGAQIAAGAYDALGLAPEAVTSQAAIWLDHAAEIGLGTNDLKNITLVEVNLK
jgi:hypothetical protein